MKYIQNYQRRRRHSSRWTLPVLLAITFAAAACGAFASINAQRFYAELAKPGWAPPAGVFGPVWSALYLMMAIAAWLVVRDRGWQRSRLELGIYCTQLTLNALWSWLFFHWHAGNAALFDIALLWLAIVCTCVLFWRSRVLAAVLLLPYLAWVSFAAVLTYAVCTLNPQLL